MTTIIKCSKLIDGLCDNPIENGMVVIEDRNIAYAGVYDTDVEAKYIAGEHQMIQAEGKTVMPGLIDTHVHLTMYGGPDNIDNALMDSASYTAFRAWNGAQKILEAGFTTIRCLGEKSEVDFGLRQAINEELVIGPRILASGKCLTITGGHGDMYPSDTMLDFIGEVVDGTDEIRKAARKRLKYNADCIKLMATGGANSSGPAQVSQLNEDEMRAAVLEAEKRGKITAAHAVGTDGIKNALRAGVRTIEHGSNLDDECIELMLNNGAFLVPTLVAFRTLKPNCGVPDHVIQKLKGYRDDHINSMKKAYKAGVKIILGSDTGTPNNYPGDEAEELELYTTWIGMTPMEAIKSATSVAAEALFLEDTGVLASGKAADLLIVDGDPVTDIRILQNKNRIEVIMRNGKVLVDRTE